jgi:pyroglutamyl-peptidase
LEDESWKLEEKKSTTKCNAFYINRRKNMRVLITGFTPFGGEKINPSWEAIKRMKDNYGDIKVFKSEIPTVFNKAIYFLEEEIQRYNPDVVICTGQAGGRTAITPERVAINVNDARIPDNEGNTPIDKKIFEDGENAYFSSLPIKAIVKELRQKNIPATVSNSAGTFVCNNIMYGLLYYIDKNYENLKGGFVHIPYIHEQVVDKPNNPSMDLETIKKAFEIIIETIFRYDSDIAISDGKTR